MSRWLAFFDGAMLSAALILSIQRCRRYPNVWVWWNAEGITIWMLAGIPQAALL